MARTVLQCMRHRRRRWLALWAAFALLFNQIALAQHLCLDPGAASNDVAASAQADCHAGSLPAATTPDADVAACAVHCDDGDKQARDHSPIKVPDLAADLSEVASLRPVLFALECALPPVPPAAYPRRTTDYCVLLI